MRLRECVSRVDLRCVIMHDVTKTENGRMTNVPQTAIPNPTLAFSRVKSRSGGHSAKMSIYSGFLYAKFFDCGVSPDDPFSTHSTYFVRRSASIVHSQVHTAIALTNAHHKDKNSQGPSLRRSASNIIMMAEHHPPMEGGQVEVASILAAAPPQETATIGGDDELLVMVAERDTNNKRSAPEEEQEEASVKRRRKNPNPPPPKKLNNEQWDLMFERLVEYKRQHGVSFYVQRGICRYPACSGSIGLLAAVLYSHC